MGGQAGRDVLVDLSGSAGCREARFDGFGHCEEKDEEGQRWGGVHARLAMWPYME